MADMRLRINLGDELLENLTLAVEESAEIMGHSSHHHFSADELSKLLLQIDFIDQLVKIVHDLATNLNPLSLCSSDIKDLEELATIMAELNENLCLLYREKSSNTAVCSEIPLTFECSASVGRPRCQISKELLEELRGLGFTWTQIANMFGVSRWTISRRVQEYGLQNLQRYSVITDEEIDDMIKSYISRHGSTTGEPFMSGYFRSKGFFIQRQRIRASLNRVDPRHTVLRWGALVSRRSYHVPWPNSLWHIDGHHSLIRWQFVIHGCIDGKSRKIMFLKCSTNNRAETVLSLFLDAIGEHGGIWPSRVRVDHGVENVLVCEAMVAKQGADRGSFIAGSSTRNQRIERLWRDVFRCVAVAFYYAFYAMEQTGILDVENPIHLFALHLVYLPRINYALEELKKLYNDHRLSSEQNWTPNQIWSNGLLNINNPLAMDMLDDDPDSIDFYGDDAQGPYPSGPQSNNVVVSPTVIPHAREIFSHISNIINPNRVSSEMAIDVYAEALTLTVQQLEALVQI